MSEKDLVQQVATYLQLQYRDLIYRFDLAADLRMTIGQATRNKRLHPRRGYPDLFIAKPVGKYHGLFIELKEANIYKKDGSFRTSEHLQEQQAMLSELNSQGYYACFCIGFDEVKQTVDKYFKNSVDNN